jgi:signal transduction histidine kinase
VHENLEQGLAAARTFLFNLRPPLLDSAGLEPALRQQLAKLAERSGCKTEVTWMLEDRLDRDLEMVAFRVVQEALANVAKHAEASTVRLWGEREGSMVVIAVADDGVGFDPRAASERAEATGHLGLRSMAERIQTAAAAWRSAPAPTRAPRSCCACPDRTPVEYARRACGGPAGAVGLGRCDVDTRPAS